MRALRKSEKVWILVLTWYPKGVASVSGSVGLVSTCEDVVSVPVREPTYRATTDPNLPSLSFFSQYQRTVFASALVSAELSILDKHIAVQEKRRES